ncbi:two-component regulator propeller domain-containing protein [Bacteroides sp.]
MALKVFIHRMVALCIILGIRTGVVCAFDSLSFEHFNMENGLSQNTITDIVQDDYGFMWFGTKDGLNRFDGLTFKAYRYVPNDSTSLGSSYILSLCKDSAGTLWVGTDMGLYAYDCGQDRFYSLSSSLAANGDMPERVNDILMDKNNDIWIAAGTQGVFKYSKTENELTHYELNGQVYAQCLEIDDKGRVWVGALNGGLFFYNYLQKKFDKLKTKGVDLSQCNTNALLYSNNRMYVGTTEIGLLVLTNDDTLIAVEHTNKEINLNTTLIHTLARKSSSEILIGTEIGMCCYNEISKEMVRYYHQVFNPRSISDSAIYSIYKDQENGIWLGTYFDGINYLPYQFSPFIQYYPQQDSPSISGERIREMCQDHMGRIWIGSEDNGLSCFDTKTNKIVRYKQKRVGKSPELLNVHGLACDDSYLWIGYYNGGIDRYDLRTAEIKYMSLSEMLGYKVNEDIFSLYCSESDSKLWIGTVRGVYTYDIRENKMAGIHELGNIFVYDIEQDKNGDYWFATLNSGVIRYRPETGEKVFYVYDEKDEYSLPSNKVLSVCVSSAGDVWFTTEGGGICRYDGQKDHFVRFNESNGLPNGVAYQIVEDSENNFWFGTNNGLVKLDTKSGAVQTYTHNNGLISNQFNYKSGLIDRNGVIYLGTVKGMIVFDPSTFVENNYKPTVALTSFSIFNEEVKIGASSPLKQSINTTQSITLQYDQSSFAFEFVVLSFSSPKRNRYAYKMEGMDKDWNLLDRNNRIFYSNLPPGDYVFKLKGANSYGIWSEQEKSIDIHILPPFYLSKAALVCYWLLGAIALCVMYILLRRRFINRHKKQIIAIEKEKEQEAIKAKIDFFTNVTHEIRTPLTLISSPLEYLLEDKELKEDVHENLTVMQQNTRRLLQLSNQLLDFQRIENKGLKLYFVDTDISQVLSDTYTRFLPTARQRSLQCSLDIPADPICAKVDCEAFVKIVSNLLNNAIKYAFTYFKVELKKADKPDVFLLMVENDGHLIGDALKDKIFEPFYQIKEEGTGFVGNGSGLGLPLARGLAQMHDGNLVYQVTPAGRNLFILSLPLKADEPEALMDGEMKEIKQECEEPPAANVASMKENGTILLVEDNVDLLELMTKWLSPEYNIVKAVNGLVALQQLENKEVDLIVSDIMMPELDGLGLLKEVRSNYKFSHIPVIFLTAKNNLNSKIESLDSGADAYIEKPFSFSYLRAQIANLLEKRKEVKRLFSLYPVDAIHSIAFNDTDQKFLANVNSTIENNIDNPELNIDLLSGELGLSRSTLNRKFRGISELSPNEYIRLYRLKKAAAYLKSGKYRINEIVFLTGFSTSSYFAKCFQKQFGMLPKEYINICRNESEEKES